MKLADSLFDQLSLNIGRIEGYLLNNAAPIEITKAFEFILEQFSAVEQHLDVVTKLDDLEARTDAIIKKEGRKKGKPWTSKEKDEVWKMRFVDDMKPSAIAKRFPNRDGPAVSNLIQQLKTNGYKFNG